MFRALPFLIFFSLFLSPIFAQNIEWEENYGGSDWDAASSIVQTSDGGFAVAGVIKSSDGDVGGNQGSEDYWILKLDANGAIEWEANYGGSGEDRARSVVQTSDSGFAVAGGSRSSDGDVQGNKGSEDCWILKLDANGAIEWEANYGGSGDDRARSIVQTSDSGFAVAGESRSSDGDVGGIPESYDYWVLKLDENGAIEWEQNYGGSDADRARSVVQTSDSGFAVAGERLSSGSYYDYWVLKLDTNGAIEWNHYYGGSDVDRARSVVQTSDSGFAVAGESMSSDGDVQGNQGSDDYWVLKLDANGGIEWEANYGGSLSDRAGSIVQTSDGGFTIAGKSESWDGDVGGNQGSSDHWILKLDTNGAIEWEENYGGSDWDAASSIVQTSDGGFAVAGESDSADGDVGGNQGKRDYWVLKLGGQGTVVHERSTDDHGFSLRPNPTSERLRIKLEEASGQVRATVHDLTGRSLKTKTVEDARTFTMKLEGEPGMYLIELRTADGERVVRRVVKE